MICMSWKKAEISVALAVLLALVLPGVVAANPVVTTTPTTRETCDNGVCTLTLYGGTRFGYEDERWKPIEDLRSFRDSTNIECVVETDGGLKAECLDWNYTSRTLRLNPDVDEISKSNIIPIKTLERGEISEKERVDFDFSKSAETVLTIEAGMSDVIHFGEESTTIQLQDSGTENMGDTYVNESAPTTNYGSSNYLFVDNTKRTYIMFNISILPDNQKILNANLTLDWEGSSNGGKAYHCFNHSWSEGEITWDNQPCNGTWDSSKCNSTEESPIFGFPSGFHTYDVTNATRLDYGTHSNITFVINSTITFDERYYSKEYPGIDPYLNITYEPYYPEWYTNQSSIASKYNPSTTSEFNITWNTSGDEIDTVFIELNHTGTPANYTMSNETYLGDIYNFIAVIGANNNNSQYWISCANTTGGSWNCTDSLPFTIYQNDSNPSHTNITIAGSSSIDSDASTYSDVSVTVGGHMDYSDGGTALLWINGVSYPNPTTQTFGIGSYNIKVNTSGNVNYTANDTGFTALLTVNTPAGEGAGGGGTGGWTPVVANCSTYTMQPKSGFVGSAEAGQDIQAFTLSIWNGNTSQLFYIREFTGNLSEYCIPTSQPLERTPTNGYDEIKFKCTAPNGTATGNIVIATDSGCEDSRPVTIYSSSDILADITDVLEALASGNIFLALSIVSDIGGFRIPTLLLMAMVMLAAIVFVLWAVR